MHVCICKIVNGNGNDTALSPEKNWEERKWETNKHRQQTLRGGEKEDYDYDDLKVEKMTSV